MFDSNNLILKKITEICTKELRKTKEGEKMEIKCTVEELKELLNNKTPVAGTTDVKITANIISDGNLGYH